MAPINMKEPVNAWTHFGTLIAAFIALPVLILLARKTFVDVLVVTVYGFSMIALYTASTLYHWMKTTPRRELILRRIDHGSINLLIAGSATPVFYYGLHGTWRVAMICAVWAFAALSGVLQVVFIKAPRWLHVCLYMLLGWTAVIPFPQLLRTLPAATTILIIAGGLSYTVGAVIYATKKLDFLPGRFGFHEVFHLFVSAGSAVHFAAILILILPRVH